MSVVNFNKAVNHAHIGYHFLPIALKALKSLSSLNRVVLGAQAAHVVARAAVRMLQLPQLLLMVFVVQVLLHGLQERPALKLKRTVAHFIFQAFLRTNLMNLFIFHKSTSI